METVLKLLKQGQGYISGEEMSEQLHITRAAVWKQIDHLRQEGYDISAVPHLGYKLESSPDKFLPAEITSNLKTQFIGHNARTFETVSSTMDEAFRLAMDKAPEGTIVCAETQTKGRGRLGRRWHSPKGKGIYCSLILRPRFPPGQAPQLTLMTAVAISQAIENATGIKARIKWPNDLLVEGKKLAGILTELRAETDRIEFVVIGFGINVNTTAPHLVGEATSLKIVTNQSWNRVALLQEVLSAMEHWYKVIGKEGFEPVLNQWRQRSETLKKKVRISDSSGTVEGVAIDLDADGGLLIRQVSGALVKKMAGDIVHFL